MARLHDPEILARYQTALSNWHVTGYVEWNDRARDWVLANLAGIKPRQVAELMWQHVQAGGEIDQVPERRPEWDDYEFHYDLRIRLADRRLYLETVLLDDDPDDPTIRIVSIHDA